MHLKQAVDDCTQRPAFMRKVADIIAELPGDRAREQQAVLPEETADLVLDLVANADQTCTRDKQRTNCGQPQIVIVKVVLPAPLAPMMVAISLRCTVWRSGGPFASAPEQSSCVQFAKEIQWGKHDEESGSNQNILAPSTYDS